VGVPLMPSWPPKQVESSWRTNLKAIERHCADVLGRGILHIDLAGARQMLIVVQPTLVFL